jgi:uncharacterized lipoprotein YmbA
MMTRRIVHLLSVGFMVAAIAACGRSAPARFYTLAPTATAAAGSPLAVAVVVGPVTVPAAVDRPEFVVQVAPNRVEIDEFNRWIAPLDDAIARAVAGDLATLLGSSRVAPAPFAYGSPDFGVQIDVQRFESAPGGAVVVDAVWAVRPSAGGAARAGRTVAREEAGAPGFDALAAALSRALETVSADIATVIREAARSGGRR